MEIATPVSTVTQPENFTQIKDRNGTVIAVCLDGEIADLIVTKLNVTKDDLGVDIEEALDQIFS